MFENSGEKLKAIAQPLFYIITVISLVIAGYLALYTKISIIIWILIAVGGPVSAYVGCLVLHAFGEITDNTAVISFLEPSEDSKSDE